MINLEWSWSSSRDRISVSVSAHADRWQLSGVENGVSVSVHKTTQCMYA